MQRVTQVSSRALKPRPVLFPTSVGSETQTSAFPDVCLLTVTRARLPVPPLLLLLFGSATHPAVQLLIQEPPSKPPPCTLPPSTHICVYRLTWLVCPLCHPAVHQPASQLSTTLPAQLALGMHGMDAEINAAQRLPAGSSVSGGDWPSEPWFPLGSASPLLPVTPLPQLSRLLTVP